MHQVLRLPRRPRFAGYVWPVVASLAMCAACTAPREVSPEKTAGSLETDLESYLEIVDPSDQVRAILVQHAGASILENYRGGASPDDYWDIQSVGKSVMSALIGIALGEGHLRSVDQTLEELLPSYTAAMAPGVGDITLHELLTHTSGLEPDRGVETEGTSWESTDWVRHILADKGPAATGPHEFAYSSQAAHLMSPILTQATKQSALEYGREKLFRPLGIPSEPAAEILLTIRDGVPDEEAFRQYYEADFAWPVDPQGFHEGAGSIKLRAKDLAAIGQLFLDDGRWNGTQIMPKAWIERSTSPLVPVPSNGVTDAYGYMWWAAEMDGDEAFLAHGFGRQMLAVVPSRELVVVVTTEFDWRDPAYATKILYPSAVTELVDAWIAPHFAARSGD